jgi:hypothetical protein
MYMKHGLFWGAYWLQGVENVYTQHQPLLFQTMEGIVKGRLRDVDYPLVGNQFQQGRLVWEGLCCVKFNQKTLIFGMNEQLSLNHSLWNEAN